MPLYLNIPLPPIRREAWWNAMGEPVVLLGGERERIAYHETVRCCSPSVVAWVCVTRASRLLSTTRALCSDDGFGDLLDRLSPVFKDFVN